MPSSALCAAVFRRTPNLPVCSVSSPYFGTAHSAALVGVGARASATRSIRVQSVSWPTAEMSGILLAATARATISSLNPHRSSRLPPPRATISTSGLGIGPSTGSALKPLIAAATSDAHVSPCTLTGHSSTRAGNRSVNPASMSRITAPVGEVTTPMTRGRNGSLRFLRLVEQALGGELLLALFEQRHQRADAGGLQRIDHDLILGRARIGRHPPRGDDLQPFRRLDAQALHRGAPDHRLDAGLLVLQGEIAMARRMRAAKPRNLAAQPHIAVRALERALDGGTQLRHREFRQIGALAGSAGRLGHDHPWLCPVGIR